MAVAQHKDTLAGQALGAAPEAALTALGTALWAVACQPVLSVPLAVVGAVGYVAWRYVSLQLAILAGVALLLTPCAWRVAHPSSFERFAGRHLRNSRARLLTYGRPWREVMLGCGLAKRRIARDGEVTQRVARIRRVRVGEFRDEVLVRLLPGQTPALYANQAEALAEMFGEDILWVRAHSPKRGWVRLDFQRVDPLAEVIDALPIPESCDLERVQVGLLESGESWTVRVLGSHILLIGASRSGKSSFLAAMVRSMCPAIRDGLVELHGIDPKGGMELGVFEELCATFVYGTDVKAAIRLLDELNVRMVKRAEVNRKAHRRVHVPTKAEPLLLIIIDELIALYAAADRVTKPKLELGIRRLQVMGAACGVSMIAAGQNPEKKLIDNRDEFTVRVGFRMNASTHPDMTFFDGARAQGARCDEISDDPASGRGTAFFVAEGKAGFDRGRVAYCSTAVIRRMALDYSPRGDAPASYLQRVISGEAAEHVPMTPEQEREFEAIKAALEATADRPVEVEAA